MSTKEENQNSVERRWDRWEFRWKEAIGTNEKGVKIWKVTENENKDRDDEEFIKRWCEFAIEKKELHEFCRGWDWSKRKALDMRRRLNKKFGKIVLPELKNPRRPKRKPTTEELLALALSILNPKTDEKTDNSENAAK